MDSFHPPAQLQILRQRAVHLSRTQRRQKHHPHRCAKRPRQDHAFGSRLPVPVRQRRRYPPATRRTELRRKRLFQLPPIRPAPSGCLPIRPIPDGAGNRNPPKPPARPMRPAHPPQMAFRPLPQADRRTGNTHRNQQRRLLRTGGRRTHRQIPQQLRPAHRLRPVFLLRRRKKSFKPPSRAAPASG